MADRPRPPTTPDEHRISFDPAALKFFEKCFTKFSEAIAAGLTSGNAQILSKLALLEKHLSAQDEKIAAFKASTDAKFVALGTALDTIAGAQANIAADEAALLAKLNTLEDLTPASQTILDEVTAGLTAIVTRSETAATSLQALADSLPDTVEPLRG